MNLPNKLTLLRFILIPVFVIALMLIPKADYCRYIALAIFAVACLTDFMDGRIARKRNLVTNFGKLMDPLADKLLVCSALICLLKLDLIPEWVVLLIVAREFIISGFRLVAVEQGVVLAASKMAKTKTAVQMIMIVCLILNFESTLWHIVCQVLIYLSLVLTIASLLEYLIKNRNVLKGPM